MNDAQITIAIVAAVIVLTIIVVALSGEKQPDPTLELEPWRQALAALQAQGFPASEVSAWIDRGENLAKRFEVRAAVQRLADRMAGSAGSAFSHDQEQAHRIRAEILAIQSARAMAAMMVTQQQAPTVSELAKLRTEGLISEDEFRAFSERFTKSQGEKATEIIRAIRDLHEQHRTGAMTLGNYHASLWTLMDKLDRDLRS